MAAQPPRVLFVGVVTFGGVTYMVWASPDHHTYSECHGIIRHRVRNGDLYLLIGLPIQDGGGGNGGGGGSGGGGNGGSGGVLFSGFGEFSGVKYRVWGILVGTPHNYPEHYGFVLHNSNLYAVVGHVIHGGGNGNGGSGGGGDGDGGNGPLPRQPR